MVITIRRSVLGRIGVSLGKKKGDKLSLGLGLSLGSPVVRTSMMRAFILINMFGSRSLLRQLLISWMLSQMAEIGIS
jgi:hypothetical protein